MDHERFREWFSRVDELTAAQRKEVSAVLSEPPEGAAPRSGRDGGIRGSGALPFHGAPARSIDGYAIPYVEPLRSRVSVDQRHHELPLAGIGQVASVAAYLNPLDRDLRASAGDSPAGERIGIAPKDDLMVPRRRPVMAPQVHRMEPAELVSHLHARSVVVFAVAVNALVGERRRGQEQQRQNADRRAGKGGNGEGLSHRFLPGRCGNGSRPGRRRRRTACAMCMTASITCA